MIYAIAPDIRVSDVNYIKFGKSKNPKERLSTLQSGNPIRLKLCAEMDWPDDYERRIHQKFASKRQAGEWFEVDDELHDFMNLVSRDPDSARALLG